MTSMTTHARRATPDADADADGTDLRLVVTGGVDTHGQTHHAAALDHLGRQIADEQFLANPVGYRQMLAWLRSHGELGQVGVEGTGAYGAALARHLSAAGVTVIEVDRPDRRSRRAVGKSDPLDAYSAARAVLSGQANGTPKTRNGQVEAIRVLRVARRSALKARTQAMNQLRALLVTGPAELREQMRPLNTKNLIASCARLRPTAGPGVPLDPEQAVKTALRHLARRHQHLSQENKDTDRDLHALLTAAAPRLLALKGVGTDVAGALVVSTGDNPHRLRNEARSPTSPASHRYPPAAAGPTGTASTAAATEPPTTPCTPSPWSASAATPAPAPTPNDDAPKDSATKMSCAASSATSPAKSSPQ